MSGLISALLVGVIIGVVVHYFEKGSHENRTIIGDIAYLVIGVIIALGAIRLIKSLLITISLWL